MGFSWGTAGLIIPVMGLYAEMTSVASALLVVSFALFPAAAIGLAPSERQQQNFDAGTCSCL